MVAGKILVQDGRILVADESAIQAEAQRQAHALVQRVADDPLHENMALMRAMDAGQL